ncbi:MAG: ABC transporter permease [SAR202 cluster bacterium]|jgi:peptide/nickel transport system permease protein|nr:ABC transporter permease [SAR202 cluster bacterium]
MQVFLVRRFFGMLVDLIAVTIIVFAMSRGQCDPMLLYLNDSTTEEQWDTWGREVGLDRPVVVRYAVWFGKALRGDLGTSLREARHVTTAVMERALATLQLGLASWIFAIGVARPLGVLSAVKRATLWGYLGI